MSTAFMNHLRSWGWMKRLLLLIAALTFLCSSFLFLTPIGESIRVYLAKTVITTQHRDWAWIFVGAQRRDQLVKEVQDLTEINSMEKQDLQAVKYEKNRSMESLIKVEDISGQFWKGKKMYVYDPTTIRVVVPAKQGEGERITSMVQRTGAVAGVNGGGFNDPDGLGNGFAPIGAIMSGGNILYTDQEGSIPQQIVGFTKEGTLIIGKYSINELLKLNVTEAVSFYPRVIANGKGLITSGDGGWGRAPRTAVGQKADGTVIFIVIDGRQAQSVGATLKEVQDLFLAEGVINAGFLDGGASSEMVVDDQLVTSPSSRYGERRLPSAFLVFDHPDEIQVDNVWAGLTEIDPGGAYDHPDYLREQALKKANQAKATPAPTAKPKATVSPSPSASVNPDGSVKPSASNAPGSTPAASVQPGASAKPGESPVPQTTPKAGATSSAAPAAGTGQAADPAAGTGSAGTAPMQSTAPKQSDTPAAVTDPAPKPAGAASQAAGGAAAPTGTASEQEQAPASAAQSNNK
ncbi:phosphodiester glycosidase family protein [Paenibacillus hexagrammi]|uniref:Phosphodiester glycosidase family protein n=1 Tax=Paenibacillus hexagrammi TaxID=2908839 RepID=A0ABY3SF07_9BACL|nr:phosphodiester glycosidase family protein [Paenibacillus sp. YPD9-1]UJF32015.1 phosphodiester glycosidase family protein [Paenibacillus sp. YPD9-1]